MAMEVIKEEMEGLDMISELPEFILHLILSFLTTEEACRTSILSKKWYNAWASNPILDFEAQYKRSDEEIVQSYVGFIDKTMRRYSMQKHFIKKFHLWFPVSDEKFSPFIDKWIGIAVECKIEELDLDFLTMEISKYQLPKSLFSAKSLKVLICQNLELPYYGIMKLHFLQYLSLSRVRIHEPMLQLILSLCPLIDLHLTSCSGLKNISIPWGQNFHESAISSDHNTMHCDVKASLESFYYSNDTELCWPCKFNAGVLKNLRTISIDFSAITDADVSVLVSELFSLESLSLLSCFKLQNIDISSKSLKDLMIAECYGLRKATLDAPNMVSFWYNGEPELSLSMGNTQVHCNTHFFVSAKYLSIEWFITVKEFLVKSNIFKTLEINLEDCQSQVELDKDMLKQISVGSLYKLKEVKIHDTDYWKLTESSVSAFLDGLFWSFHLDFLTILTNIQNPTLQFLMEALKEKVNCWKHPLKRIEVEGVDFYLLLSNSELETRFRLFW